MSRTHSRRSRPHFEALEARVVPDGASFVGQLYRDFLNRAADPGGLAYWSGRVTSSDRTQVALGLLSSAEGRGQAVRELYLADLGRGPDQGGLGYFTSVLGNGATLDDVRAGLLGSQEYLTQRTAGTLTGFVTNLYFDVLGRGPDSEGLAFWSAVVETPLGRSGTALAMLTSVEGRRQTTVDDAQRLLGSTVEDATLQGLLASSNPRERVLAGLASLDDYLARVERLLPNPVGPVAILETSPVDGETLVSPARTVTVSFTGTIDPATVTTETFALLANGQPLAGRVRVAPTRTFATFFPENPLPASTQVRAVLDGERILAGDGRRLDADANGQPGGLGDLEFRTLPLSRIPGTHVFGFVYDSYRKNPDGSDRPVVGATIRVDAFPEANVVTDGSGRFELRDMPAPVFFVHIDGSTATNAPPGTAYPSVGKPFHSVPGQTVQLTMDGSPFHVYLPPMAASDVVPLSTTEDVVVGFGPAGRAELAQMFPDLDATVWDKVRVTYPAGSAIDRQGNPATEAVVIPVPPSRLPAPLPPQLDPQLIVSVQAPGAALFDVPAPLTFPNLDNLPLGSRPAFWSFDHAVGAWHPIGIGTVVDDGQGGTLIVSDPGVGIRAPGWHGVSPPTSWAGDGDKPREQSGREPPPTLLPALFNTSARDVLTLEFEPPEGKPKEPGKHEKKQDPYKKVTLLLKGPLHDYYKQTRGMKLGDGIALEKTLKHGDKKLEFRFEQLGLKELQDKHTGGRPFNLNTLYGSQLSVRVEDHHADGTTDVMRTIYLPYVFIDAADDQHEDRLIDFEDTLGNGSVRRTKEVEVNNGGAVLEASAASPFSASSSGDEVRFQPSSESAGQTGTLTLKTTVEGRKITLGTLGLRGNGLAKQHFFVDEGQFKSALNLMLASGEVRPEERPFLEAAQDDFIAEVVNRARTLLAPFSAGLLYGSTSNAHLFNEFALGLPLVPIDADILRNINTELGNQINFLKTAQTDIDNRNGSFSVTDVLKNVDKYGRAEQTFRLSRALNESQAGETKIFLDRLLFLQHTLPRSIGPIPLRSDDPGPWMRDELVNSLAGTIAHEFAHGLGLEHTDGNGDLMRPGNDRQGQRGFQTGTSEAMRIALGLGFNDDDAQRALSYFEASPANGQSFLDDGADQPLTVLSDRGLLLIRDENDLLTYEVDFGATPIEGITVTRTLTLENVGTAPLTLGTIRLSRGAETYALLDDLTGRILAPGAQTTLRLRFDPVTPGAATGTLALASDGDSPEVRVGLTGFGTTSGPALAVAVANNNLGGAVVGGTSAEAVDFAALTNVSAAPLTILGVDVVVGAADFRVQIPDAALPLTLATGQTVSLGATFIPSRTGLVRGTIRLTTNDATRPIVNIPVVGTGVPTGPLAFQWGQDPLLLSYGNFTRRQVTNIVGGVMLDLPAETDYQVHVFEPVSGLIAVDGGTSAPSGAFTDLTSSLRFLPSVSPDADGDGLPNDIENVLGTDVSRPDSNGDGIDDFSALQQGFDPLAGRAVPIGFVSSVDLPGGGFDVIVEGKRDAPGQLAYVATGRNGLAIVDVSDFANPIVLGQLDLPGDAVSIGVDPVLRIAAVATVDGGLCLVDISDPMRPQLRTTVNRPVFRVVVADGVAYAALINGAGIVAIDLVSGEALRSVTVPLGVQNLEVRDDVLYVLSSNFFSTYAIGAAEFRALGGVVVGGRIPPLESGSPIFVAGDRAYIGSFTGYSVVDVSDPEHLLVLGTPPSIQLVDHHLALNGSGLLVVSSSFSGPGSFGVSLYDARDDADVTRLLTTFPTPNERPSFALAGGLAFVATERLNGFQDREGTGNLRVLNYLPFDNRGLAPTVSLSSPAPDVDPAAGVQVASGTRIPIRVAVQDDVQIRNVEILVNGQVLANRVAYPFDLSLVAVPPADGSSIRVQARATDTGGNTSLSDVLTFEVSSRALHVASTSPGPGLELGRSPSTLRVTLDKPLDPNRLPTTSAFQLVGAGPDGVFGNGDDLGIPIDTVRANPSGGELALTPASLLAVGSWRLTVLSDQIRDLAGEPLDGEFTGQFPSGDGLSGGNFVLEFRVLPLRVVASTPAPGLRTDVGISSISLSFSRSVDITLPQAADFLLVSAGPDRAFDTADDQTVSLAMLVFTPTGDGLSLPIASSLAPGLYRLTARANRLRDVEGQPMDGEFQGSFPSGDGVPGGDFIATFEVLPPQEVAETPFPMPAVETAPLSANTGLVGSLATGPALLVDLNGDGQRDLVRGNENAFDSSIAVGQSLSVLLGRADGTFGDPLTLPLTAPTRGLAVGDLNGDGDLDLVALTHARGEDPTTTSPFAIHVMLGRGDGTFMDATTVNPGTGALNAPNEADFVLGELTGDSQLDLAVLLPGISSSTRLLLLGGNGDGTFAAPQPVPLGRDAHGDHLLRAADLNNDDKTDLVTQTTVLLGNGDGTFTAREAPSRPVAPTSGILALADVDGDGRLDLLADTATGGVAVHPGLGDGTFGAIRDEAVTGLGQLFAVAVGDVNGDGHRDVVLHGDFRRDAQQQPEVDGQVTLLPGRGDGTFGPPSVLPFALTGGAALSSLALADVNGDGHADLMAAQSMPAVRPSIVFALGRGNGTFQISNIDVALATPLPRLLADVNGDSRRDVITFDSPENPGLLVRPGLGNGTFGPAVLTPLSWLAAAAPEDLLHTSTDLNGDGRPDLVAGVKRLSDNNQRVLLGRGDGTFEAIASPGSVGKLLAIDLADLSGDGVPDLMLTHEDATFTGSTSLSVRLGRGDGTFGTAVKTGPLDVFGRPVLADVNGDGRADVVTTQLIVEGDLAGSVTVYLSNGDGTLTTGSSFGLPLLPQNLPGEVEFHLAPADVDRDGRLDLLVSVVDRVFLYPGQGDGTFLSEQPIPGHLPGEMSARDIDGDGPIDLIFSAEGSVRVLYGRADVTFESPRLFDAPRSIEALIGDLNGDGRLDLIGGATILLQRGR